MRVSQNKIDELQGQIKENPKIKSQDKKKIENRMSALRSRMRKKEQKERADASVKKIADIVEDELQKDKSASKVFKKIKDRVDKALSKMKKETGDSLAESIVMYYTANGEDEIVGSDGDIDE